MISSAETNISIIKTFTNVSCVCASTIAQFDPITHTKTPQNKFGSSIYDLILNKLYPVYKALSHVVIIPSSPLSINLPIIIIPIITPCSCTNY